MTDDQSVAVSIVLAGCLLASACGPTPSPTPFVPDYLPRFTTISCEPQDPVLVCRCIGLQFRADPWPEDLSALAVWQSSNPDAISVQAGRVTALQPGRSTITAIYAYGPQSFAATQLVIAHPGTPPRPAWPFRVTLCRGVQPPYPNWPCDPITGADIEVRAPFDMTFRLVSDERGEFGFDAIAGDYLFRMSKTGFHTTFAPRTVPLTLPPGLSYLSEWITLVEDRSGA